MFENYSNIKFHENPSSGSRVVPCGRKDGRTDGRIYRQKVMTNMIIDKYENYFFMVFMVAPCIDGIKFFIRPTNAHKLH
jgi:hypothetical protein